MLGTAGEAFVKNIQDVPEGLKKHKGPLMSWVFWLRAAPVCRLVLQVLVGLSGDPWQP